jgi:hypothetical protein
MKLICRADTLVRLPAAAALPVPLPQNQITTDAQRHGENLWSERRLDLFAANRERFICLWQQADKSVRPTFFILPPLAGARCL